MKKNFLSIILATALVLSLVACGGSSESSEDSIEPKERENM